MNYKILSKFKSNIAFITEKNEKKTYKNFIQDIKNNNDLGIKNNSLVFLNSSQTYTFCCLYYYFIINKIVPVILNENIDKRKMGDLVIKYSPNVIISLSKLNNKSYMLETKFENYFIYKKKIPIKININPEISILMSTSGSTGNSKFVALSKQNILFNTKSIVKYLKISSRDTTITSLPLSYSFGLSVLNTHLYKGGKIILSSKSFFQKDFWDYFKSFNISYLYGVPFSFEILFKLGLFQKNLNSIKYFAVAGGALSKELLKKYLNYCLKTKKKFICMYGQTEATTRISYLPFKNLTKKIGSIGKAIPGGKLKIYDLKGNQIIQSHTEGELIYEGKNVMIGYIENLNDLIKKRNNKFKLFTGDIGYFDKENFFYITGRKKRIIKIYGHRISLDQLQIYLQSKNITNACIAKNDILYTFIVDHKYSTEEIIKLINLYIGINISKSFKLIKIKSLPANRNGKIEFQKLYEYFK